MKIEDENLIWELLSQIAEFNLGKPELQESNDLDKIVRVTEKIIEIMLINNKYDKP